MNCSILAEIRIKVQRVYIFNPNKCSASYHRPAIRKSEIYFQLLGTNCESMLTKILIAIATFCPQTLEDSGIELSPAGDGRRGGGRRGGDSAGIGLSPSRTQTRRESRRRRGERASPKTPTPKSNSPTAPKKQRY